MTPSRLGMLRQACLECKACALGLRPVTEVTPVFGRRACETEPETLAVLDPTDVSSSRANYIDARGAEVCMGMVTA